jgi:hypothetical protein
VHLHPAAVLARLSAPVRLSAGLSASKPRSAGRGGRLPLRVTRRRCARLMRPQRCRSACLRESGGGAQLPRVIFTTPDDQCAAMDFEMNAVDCLLKPIEPDRLRAAHERVRSAPSAAPAAEAGLECAVRA